MWVPDMAFKLHTLIGQSFKWKYCIVRNRKFRPVAICMVTRITNYGSAKAPSFVILALMSDFKMDLNGNEMFFSRKENYNL